MTKLKPSPNLPNPLLLNRFFSFHSPMETNLNDFINLKLVEPKLMEPSFFSDEGFRFQEHLQFQGLNTFVSLNANYLIELIKVFYCNLKLVDGDLVTEVKGTPIRITPSDWLTVTGLRHEGVTFSTTSEISNWKGYDRTIAVKGMLKDPSVVPASKIMAGKLTVEDRMLHYVFAWILIPRGSNYAQLREEDVFVMWLMKQRLLINWPCYMSNHMMKVKNRHMKDLPYAFLITKFLEHFQIDTTSEAEVVPKGFNKFARGAMNHMKLKRVNGVWVTTGDPAAAAGDLVQAAREDEAHDMDAEETQHPLSPAAPDEAHGIDVEETQHPPAPAAPDDRFDLLIAQMQDLKKFVGERFDHLDSTMASLDARLKVLENRKRLDNLASFSVSGCTYKGS
ncbi:uncharacterized protein LOC130738046 [Lotus japonicus]|uniref:uncharacterized protein LOC130738046 n=1 Tax=Lotus japonicus TaxID=34305 RepID=UPI00258C763F|nr:uncharacterized protein LOC130738046 [Lotus japonicus]